MTFDKEKRQHQCPRPTYNWPNEGPHSWSSHGPSIRYILYDQIDQKWYADCDEYASEIFYCPFCGAKLLDNGFVQSRSEVHWEM